MVFQYPKCALYLFSWESTPNENSTPVYYLPMQTSKDCADVPGNLFHRLLLLKLDKQIGGTSLFSQRTRHVTWRGWDAMLEGVEYSKHASFMDHYSKGTHRLK